VTTDDGQGTAETASSDPTGLARWWVYQRERFPLVQHGPLIFAFSFCAVSYSHHLRGAEGPLSVAAIAVAFGTAFLFFLQLRIADEFKDHEEDCRYRPYRAVPRGLVSLRELGVLGVACAVIQALLAIALKPTLLLWLLIPWAYLALMSKEFFVRRWIMDRPVTYLWTHMFIMPLVDFYATATDWHVAAGAAPRGLGWFLGASYFNGIVIEVGRKIRAPEDEEEGVRTYTVLWGRPRALLAWLGAMVISGAMGVFAAHRVGVTLPVAICLGVVLLLAIKSADGFARRPTSKGAKWIELTSGVWTLALYLSLGVGPMLWSSG